MINDTKIIEALITISDLINPITQNWLLIGSSSLLLQGYPVMPNDIDILCSTEVAALIEILLSDYCIPPDINISKNKFCSKFSRYHINGIYVELMGDLEVNTNQGWVKVLDHIESSDKVMFEDHFLNVPVKADQLMIYNLFGREKDKHIIKMLMDDKCT